MAEPRHLRPDEVPPDYLPLPPARLDEVPPDYLPLPPARLGYYFHRFTGEVLGPPGYEKVVAGWHYDPWREMMVPPAGHHGWLEACRRRDEFDFDFARKFADAASAS